jgi:hypothetical protein
VNLPTDRAVSKRRIRSWRRRLLALSLLAFGFAGWLIADDRSADLTVHEWGTFTAIAGKDGRAMEWTPLIGLTDLPGFVEHIDDANFKLGLRGTIRMETPVLYFYSPRDVRVSVHVTFSKGIISEWYPRAKRVQPQGNLRTISLSRLQRNGGITWTGVAVSPNLSGDFPREVPSNRYYAARETSSSPLRVTTTSGEQQEKFLFYRGVSAASLPLSASQDSNGQLIFKSLGEDKTPAVILFKRRGQRVGYRLERTPTEETVLEPPALTDSVDSLCTDLQGILVDQGLYPDEAHAMVQTWQDSWFEEGTRLIYVVPRRFIDNVLPLTVDPAPKQTVRVFVGRLEIVTPATERAVKAAIASNDKATLNTYGRFLEPILQIVNEERLESARESHLH